MGDASSSYEEVRVIGDPSSATNTASSSSSSSSSSGFKIVYLAFIVPVAVLLALIVAFVVFRMTLSQKQPTTSSSPSSDLTADLQRDSATLSDQPIYTPVSEDFTSPELVHVPRTMQWSADTAMSKV